MIVGSIQAVRINPKGDAMKAQTLFFKQVVFARNTAKLIQYINDNNHFCTWGEAFRTAEQAAIYAKNGKGILNSLHCSRLAIDLNLFNLKGDYLTLSKDYEPFGVYWESLNVMNRWGGRFKRVDGNHYEMRRT